MPDHITVNILGFKFQVSPTRLYVILSGLLLPPLDIADRLNICGVKRLNNLNKRTRDFIFFNFGSLLIVDILENILNTQLVPNVPPIYLCDSTKDVDPILDPLLNLCRNA